MSYFCPMCANILLTETANDGALRMYCATCPYICPITRPISITLKLERKKVDAVFSDDTFASARTTEGTCVFVPLCTRCTTRTCELLQSSFAVCTPPCTYACYEMLSLDACAMITS